jgi:5-methylcytosine-specific restriction enzyme A
MLFIPGQIYHRRSEIHGPYGGQQQGGMSTPSAIPCIFLFTGESGTYQGYQDQWISKDTFRYTGEGQVGDMTFVRANRALRDHLADRKDVHLFESVRTPKPNGYVRYVGQMVVTGWTYELQTDGQGRPRQAIVFELTLVESLDAEPAEDSVPEPTTAELANRPLSELRTQALSDAAPARDAIERVTRTRYWSKAIKAYALARAQGVCEGCGQNAPFVTAAGVPFLEVHHIGRLSDGGPDHPEHVAAVCPNCHRRAHYSVDEALFNSQLQARVRQREDLLAARP